MANPTVDKMKAFGLRHGEKVAMAVVAVIFVYCSYAAWSHPSIEISPDEVQKAAQDAQTNITRQQSEETILAKLDEQGVKPQDFQKKVVAMQKGPADASKYALVRPFVLPEPGAGLIRDMPELLAPQKLLVHSGRGAVRVIKLDDEGNMVMKSEADKKAPPRKKPKRPRSSGMGRGMGGGMMGGMGGGRSKSKKSNTGALAEAEKKKQDEEAERRKKLSFAGDADAAKTDEDKPEEEEKIDFDKVETTLHGFRFVTMVGRFPHKEQKEKYARALKLDAASADPNYLRLEVERQERQADNSWGDWASVNREKYEDVRELLTKTEDEIVPTTARISTLIDPLPFLEVGYWVGAHPLSLVPKELTKPKEAAKDAGKMAGGGRSGGIMTGNSMKTSDYSKGGMGGMGAGYGAAMGGGGFDPSMMNRSRGGGGGGDQGDFEKATGDFLMVRALDFDVEPDAEYRYRARIVVANPNHNRDDVAPGVDTKSKELPGPWSEPTAEVDVPADVSTYAIRKTPAGADSAGDNVEFQVAAWNPADGLTVVRTFNQHPGEIIGTKDSVLLPNDAKDGTQRKTVDFTSHQVLADAIGGDRPAEEIKDLGASRLEVPVLALVVRNDGVLVLRDQAKDASSGEKDEMKAIYDQIMADVKSDKKKEKSTLGGGLYGGSGGGYGGMGGGMRGAN